MLRAISGLFRRDEGQDLADYCLLTALIALVAAGILFRLSGGIEGLWTIGNRNLNAANAVVENNGVSGSPR